MGIPLLDFIALGWFLLCWVVYARVANRRRAASPSLRRITYAYREQWMLNMLERDNRILDSTLVGNLMGSVSFFASTTIIIVGGLVAALGAADQAAALTAALPFATPATPQAWELRVIVLLTAFVYAFFKFTWALRQFNYCCILIGAAPLHPDPESGLAYARRTATLHALAGDHFNRGLRAYYFGLAVLAWFINAWLFMAVTAWVLWILYRREFASDIVKTLGQPEEMPAPGRPAQTK